MLFGLAVGYSLLVFVYKKTDDASTLCGNLNMNHVIFVEKGQTADYQTTTGLQKIIQNNGNEDDLVGYMLERNLPLDDIEAYAIARELLKLPTLPTGYLTISNALQWRLQYGRVISHAGKAQGLFKIV